MNINKYKNFNKILNKLNKLNSTNYTKIKKFIKTQKSEYYSIAEEISKSVFYFEKKMETKKVFCSFIL